MAKRRSAYEIPFERVELTADQRRQALLWWQSGADYHPLLCPICGTPLDVDAAAPQLRCSTSWCSYATDEVPWGVYVAWRSFAAQAREGSDD